MENTIETPSRKDKGFTLVELLIVIVILGVLATVTVFAVRGVTDRGKTSACKADRKTLETAAEAYFAQYGGTAIATQAYAANTGYTGSAAQAAVSAPTGVTAGATPKDTLVNAGFVRSAPSNYFVLSAGGALIVTSADCGTVGSPPT